MAKKVAKKKVAKKRAAKKKVGGNSLVSFEHRRALFIEAYLTNGHNKTQAAIAAGYSERTACTQGNRLFRRVEVQREIAERSKAVAKKVELNTEVVMQELSAILRSDPRKVFGEDGQMIPVHLWSDEVAAAVSSVEVIEMAGDDDQKPATVKKVKFWDKNSAIDKAMKHMGLFEKDNRQKNGALGDLPRELLQEIVERIRQVNEQQRRAITVD